MRAVFRLNLRTQYETPTIRILGQLAKIHNCASTVVRPDVPVLARERCWGQCHSARGWRSSSVLFVLSRESSGLETTDQLRHSKCTVIPPYSRPNSQQYTITNGLLKVSPWWISAQFPASNPHAIRHGLSQFAPRCCTGYISRWFAHMLPKRKMNDGYVKPVKREKIANLH
jgi:hypothetical protein